MPHPCERQLCPLVARGDCEHFLLQEPFQVGERPYALSLRVRVAPGRPCPLLVGGDESAQPSG
eukprot:14558961-Alexandrium_andersonii.AAC.1